ncbi:IclR family transcriptional regulator [Bacillus sp. Marseille-P3661]|uniref:IclR family transcriptional regulator n=1 Tax=Bacillus sp. Marseille-P3661 TaxID=1936234 RepID=UPI000C85150D|nr:IclR family transcriptional regulator [Bacillus sp. Marseille-P3661]
MKSTKQEYTLSSVKNALQILKSFSDTNQEKKTGELATELGLGKSTVSRLLSTLASEGFVKKNKETNRYRLGFSILTLSNVLTANLEIHQEAVPELQQLVNKVNETAHLVLLDQQEVVYLQKIECDQPVRITTKVGSKNPLHCTSSGKVILAYKSPTFVDEILNSGLEKFTNYTIIKPDILKDEFERIKQIGYAVSNEEYIVGVCSIAAPIFNHNNEIIAAINIVGPVQRMNRKTIPKYAKEVKASAEHISKKMGYMVMS